MLSTLPSQPITLATIGAKAYVQGSNDAIHIQIPAGSTIVIDKTLCDGSMLGTDPDDVAATAVWHTEGSKVGPQFVRIEGPVSMIRLTASTVNAKAYVMRR